MAEKEVKLTKRTVGDYLHHGTKVVLAAIPHLGGSAVELLDIVITPPMVKRWAHFFNDIAERLKRLEEQGKLNFKKLSENEDFISAVLQASRMAVQTHQEEKLNALKNAVINSAIDDTLDDARRQIFFRYIDELTPWHLMILKGTTNPRNKTMITLQEFIDTYLPGFPAEEEKEFFDVLQQDLSDRGLLGPTMTGVRVSLDAKIGGVKMTSKHGDDFLRFITDQAEET